LLLPQPHRARGGLQAGVRHLDHHGHRLAPQRALLSQLTLQLRARGRQLLRRIRAGPERSGERRKWGTCVLVWGGGCSLRACARGVRTPAHSWGAHSRPCRHPRARATLVLT
jgi:hypothetical protein